MDEFDIDPAVVRPAQIAKRFRALAAQARAGKLPTRAQCVAEIYELVADAMLAKRSYETESGLRTYDAPDRTNALRGAEIAASIALDPKAKPDELPAEGSPDAAREKLREMGFEIVKVSGSKVASA